MKTILFILSLFTLNMAFAQEFSFNKTEKIKGRFAPIYKPYRTLGKATIPTGNIQKFKIRNGAGSLEITPSNEENIQIEAAVITHSIREKATNKFVDRFLDLDLAENKGEIYLMSKFRLSVKNDRVRENDWGEEVSSSKYRFPFWKAIGTPISKVNLRVKVPEGIALEINDHSGWLSLEDIENEVGIKDRSGKLTVKNVKGTIEIIDRSGRVVLSKVNGDVDLKDTSGGVVIRDVSGSLTLRDASGGISVRNVGHDSEESFVEIRDTSGRTTLSDIGGSVKIKDSSGRIEVREVEGDLVIRDRSGGIDARGVNGSVKINDRSGKVNAEEYMVKKK